LPSVFPFIAGNYSSDLQNFMRYRAGFRVLLSPRMYQDAKSTQPDTLREIAVRDRA